MSSEDDGRRNQYHSVSVTGVEGYHLAAIYGIELDALDNPDDDCRACARFFALCLLHRWTRDLAASFDKTWTYNSGQKAVVSGLGPGVCVAYRAAVLPLLERVRAEAPHLDHRDRAALRECTRCLFVSIRRDGLKKSCYGGNDECRRLFDLVTSLANAAWMCIHMHLPSLSMSQAYPYLYCFDKWVHYRPAALGIKTKGQPPFTKHAMEAVQVRYALEQASVAEKRAYWDRVRALWVYFLGSHPEFSRKTVALARMCKTLTTTAVSEHEGRKILQAYLPPLERPWIQNGSAFVPHMGKRAGDAPYWDAHFSEAAVFIPNGWPRPEEGDEERGGDPLSVWGDLFMPRRAMEEPLASEK